MERLSYWQTKFISSFYFSIMTMTTVGYGDIYPNNDIERVFNIIIMIIACLSFGFILNQVSLIFKDLDDTSIHRNREISYLNSYLKQYPIQKNLNLRAINYINTLWSNNILNKRK